VRLRTFIQTLVSVAFGLGFVVFGIVAFIRVGHSQQQFEARLQSVRTGKVQPETLIVVRKYVDPGKGAWPHVVFSGNRQQKVNISATRDFFNSVNLGDTILAYDFPDGYFIPQNHGGDAGVGKWLFLGISVLMGAALLAFAVARKRTKPPYGDIDALRTVMRDRMEGH
jgi:hypothetical protein